MTPGTRSEARALELTFRKKDKDVVFDSYLPYIEREAERILQETKKLKIFTVDHKNLYGNWADAWVSANLDHPATFDTIAMDPWRRKTCKSSLIAAMANFLNFDVYDLELGTLRCNAELKTLLLSTGNRSIIVVEDIDCTIHLQNRSQRGGVGAELAGYGDDYLQQRQVTLSGFLNFIDGLWSSCGDARIIVFTTNQPEKLDAALLRPGRMDVHVNMTYIKPYGFKVLAGNYLGIQDHVMFDEINELIETTQVTPAEVAEQLMRHGDNHIVLNGLIEFIKLKKKELIRKQNSD
ncbi:hypothetical protein Patl1_28983 [Pistacia atlantica]|uniref:Uncharacterized protein n=1 Tax=Pistacia atlantica TaxID=434234 RepID=A0ACC1BGZ0_9ROSI|nr:hypothetical protein Patl1_28983 [Pistacia atlantica]